MSIPSASLSAGESSYFLATTALEEFWDTSKSVVFLGEWCRRYSRKTVWEPLGGELLPTPWQERKRLDDAYLYVTGVYEKLLPIMAAAFNRMHGTAHSDRYWRIVLGPWLLYFLPVVYDRLIHIQDALEKYPGITTIGLLDKDFVTPKDTIEFVFLASNDAYNLQLFTQILRFLGHSHQQKNWKITVESTSMKAPQPSLGVRFKELARNAWNSFEGFLQDGRPIILKSAYFSRKVEFVLMGSTFGDVWTNHCPARGVAPAPLDMASRGSLESSIPSDDLFISLLKSLIPASVPLCFIERYKEVSEWVSACYPSLPKAIFSANACYYDEAFKQWQAASADQGTLLLGTQHGGNYGSIARMPSEDHETAIADRYYSWGWAREDCRAVVTPMPASKLVGRKMIGSRPRSDECLFVGTAMARYLIQLPFHTADFADYLQWQERFMDSLAPAMRAQMRVRLHYADYGWEIGERWLQRYPDVKMQSWTTPFQESLERCRLYVCDHLSTTFIEALALDKPSILFWNPVANELRSDAQPFYDRLRDVGILHDTPEEAAGAVALRFDDVEGWWNQPACQEARRRFCQRFALTSPNPIHDWRRELRKITGGSSTSAEAAKSR